MGGRGSTPKIYERARRDDWEWLREVNNDRLRSYHREFKSQAEKPGADVSYWNGRADRVAEELQARGLPSIVPAAPPVSLTASKVDAFAASGLSHRYRKAFEAGFLAGIERPAVNYVSKPFQRAFEAGLAAGGAKNESS